MTIKIQEALLRSIIKKKLIEAQVAATGELQGVVYGSKGSLNRGGSGSNKKGEDEDFGSLQGIPLEKIPISGAGQNAAGLLSLLQGKGEKKESDRIAIVTAVHMPIYDACKGSGSFKKDVKESGGKTLFNFYKDELASKAWSAWFLNRCYLDTPAENFIIKHSNGFGHAGCCYPYLSAMKNRLELIKNPNSKKGQEIVILASRAEVQSLGGFTDGDASVVGQGGAAPTLGFIANQGKLSSGSAHMNVKSGGKWIGGNLSDTVKSAGDDTKKANAFMIMVKVSSASSSDK